MHDPDYLRDLAALRRTQPALAEECAGFFGVSDVLQWMQDRKLTKTQVDIVQQDEFNSDFLIRLADAWIVFGIT